jgi:hypothetical protein
MSSSTESSIGEQKLLLLLQLSCSQFLLQRYDCRTCHSVSVFTTAAEIVCRARIRCLTGVRC